MHFVCAGLQLTDKCNFVYAGYLFRELVAAVEAIDVNLVA